VVIFPRFVFDNVVPWCIYIYMVEAVCDIHWLRMTFYLSFKMDKMPFGGVAFRLNLGRKNITRLQFIAGLMWIFKRVYLYCVNVSRVVCC